MSFLYELKNYILKELQNALYCSFESLKVKTSYELKCNFSFFLFFLDVGALRVFYTKKARC